MENLASAAPALATLGGDACPVCDAPVRAAVDFGDFRLYACDACGSWCSDARSRAAIASFVPSDYFANQEVDRARWDALEDRLARWAPPPRAALDVGCGTGAYLAYLRQRHPDVRATGVDVDPELAARARAANPLARIVVGDAEGALRDLPGPFDRITLWDVFEHVPAPARLLGGLAERLAPGGTIFIQTIHEHSAVPTLGRWSYALTGGRLRALARRTHEPHHLVFFSRGGLERLAARAGLAQRETWYDRLALARMDGGRALTLATAALLSLENAFGGGLFANVVLQK